MKCYMMKRHRSFELCSAKVLESMGYENIDVTRCLPPDVGIERGVTICPLPFANATGTGFLA